MPYQIKLQIRKLQTKDINQDDRDAKAPRRLERARIDLRIEAWIEIIWN
jgi:hypothetical protein